MHPNTAEECRGASLRGGVDCTGRGGTRCEPPPCSAASWSSSAPYVVVGGDQTSCRLVGLQPARSYHVRVLAENSVGRSNASEVLTLTAAEEIPGGAPLDVRVVAKNSDTVQVTWKPPEKHLHHGEIMGYYIGYRVSSNSSEPFHYNTLESVPGTELRSTLSGLRSFTEYSVLVQAYNRAGAGPRSPEATSQVIFNDRSFNLIFPSAPPVDVQCTALSSQTILVLWSQPPSGEINGILLGYKVLYRPMTEWEDLSPHAEQTTQDLKLELHDLAHFCNYSIEVRAYTRKGDGVASRPIFCRTQEDVPGEPEEIKALVMDDETILLSWKPPQYPNGRIRKYKVYMRSLDGGGLAKDNFDLPPEQTYYSITHLKLHHRYEFWVRALTAVGEGDPSHRIVQAPASKVPARVASFSGHVITAWKEELRMACRMVGHPPPDRQWKLNGKTIKEDTRVQIVPDGTLVISSIQNTDAGNYTCSVKNVFGEDEIIYSVRVQESRNKGIPFAPNDFHVPSTTTSTITLLWKVSSTPGNVVQGYYLHYKREFGEWDKTRIPPENTSYTLTGLQCGTRYQFYLQAFNQLGLGTPTLTLHTRTQGSAPIPPKNADLIRENSTSISLNLASWQDGGCPITSLVVEYKLKQQLDWTLVSNNVKFEQIEFLVLDLNPETWYTLRMTAHNSAGSTIASYDFVTLTYSGATIAPELIVHSSYGHTHFYNELGIIIPIVAGIAVIIVASVGGLLYLKRRKTMYPANKYGEKNAGTDMTSETALMSEIEKKSCAVGTGQASSGTGGSIGGGDPHIPISPRDSAYLPTPMRVSLGRREDISPYATFRLPVSGGESSRMSVGEGIEPEISTDLPQHHGQQLHSQQCDKLQQLPSSYGSCADSVYTKIRKKPQYQNEGVSNTKKFLSAEGTDRHQKVYNKASSSPHYSSPAMKNSDVQQGAQSSSVTSVSSTQDELVKAFNNSFKNSMSHSTLVSGRHNAMVAQSASEHGTTDTDAADTSICKFSPSSLKTFNLMMSSYLKPEPEYECVRDLLRGQCVHAESSTSVEGSSDEGLRLPCPQPEYSYTRPVRVPKHYYSSTESNSEDAVYIWQQQQQQKEQLLLHQQQQQQQPPPPPLELPSAAQCNSVRRAEVQCEQNIPPSWRILEYASGKYIEQHREYLLSQDFNPAVLFSHLGERSWGLPNI
ncbi:Tyrosine-protein phosphatase Lar [Gryllus bimaculatus]|nr:Tyrosine-protein phosphatase Lar [Gryllus bimaculatus]